MSQNNHQTFTIPIVIFFFNRNDKLFTLLEEIKPLEPKRLFLICDGGRDAAEHASVVRLREAVESQIIWDCSVEKIYASKNLGCRQRLISGIDHVFTKVDRAIFLEDDCIPEPSFFRFCSELLEKYKDTKDIFSICGSNLNQEITFEQASSYYFSQMCHQWGWATWKDRWENYYNRDFTGLNIFWFFKIYKRLRNIFTSISMYRALKLTALHKIDTWDYQMHFSSWDNNFINIIPSRNLIKNIGFGEDATHTISENLFSKMEVYPLSNKINHPVSKKIFYEADYYYAKLYAKNALSKFKR
jgi:hypothetical protein